MAQLIIHGQICDRYSEENKSIRVIHKKNAGVSDSRNCGIGISTGNYIFFVDSDDYIDENLIETLVKNMNGFDIIKASKKNVRNGKILNEFCSKKELSSEECIKEIISGNMGGHCWGYLIRREIIEGILFDTNTSCMEDTVFMIDCILNTNKVKCIDSVFYYHTVNENGITGSTNRIEKNIHDYLYSIDKIAERIRSNSDDLSEQLEYKKLRIIESEATKLSNKESATRIINDSEINKTLIGISKDSNIKFSVIYRLFINIVIHRKIYIFVIYSKIRRVIKKILNR